MLKQLFGKNRRRMVEECDVENPATGVTLEFFTAYILHGDRWFQDPTWKPKTRTEAQAWLEEQK